MFFNVFFVRVSSPEHRFVEFSSVPRFQVLILHALDFVGWIYMVSIVSPGFIAQIFAFILLRFFLSCFFILRHLHLIWCSIDCCAFVFPPLLQHLLFSVYCIVLLFRHFCFSRAIPFALLMAAYFTVFLPFYF